MHAGYQLAHHPRTFLRNNIVIIIGPSDNIGGVRTSRLRRTATIGYNEVIGNGATMPVYTLKVASGQNQGGYEVSVYWCPYEADHHRGTTLPGKGGPDVMFTFGMDGCTLGWGSETPDKTISVRHVNHPGGEDGARLQRLNQKMICRTLLTNTKLVDPDDYFEKANFPQIQFPLNSKLSTTTFARRSSSEGWVFYTHQYYTPLGTGAGNPPKHFIGTTRVR